MTTVLKRIGKGFKDSWKAIATVKQQVTVRMIGALTKES